VLSGIVFSVSLVLGFVFLMGGGEVDQEMLNSFYLQEQPSIRPRPTYKELSSIYLFDEKKVFNLKQKKDIDVRMLQIENIEMVCFNSVPGMKNPLEVVGIYQNQLRELVSVYFQGVNPADVISPEGRENTKVELVKRMNHLLQTYEETDSDLIYNIIIENWIYV